MKTLETNHDGNWVDRLLNAWPFCLDMDGIAMQGCTIRFTRGLA